MKLLATDYDGTFKTDIKNFYLNIIEVERFREKGNKFAIVTGRSYKAIKRELKHFDIKYDYVSCNNGLVTFDSKGNIVFSQKLDKDIIDLINDTKNYNYNIKQITLYDEYDKTNNIDDVVEIELKFNSRSNCKIYKAALEKMLPGISLYRDSKKLFIGANLNKSNAVRKISELENISKENIYTVGDGNNDLEMLKDYNGSKVWFSSTGLWFENIPMTREVHTLVRKISRK